MYFVQITNMTSAVLVLFAIDEDNRCHVVCDFSTLFFEHPWDSNGWLSWRRTPGGTRRCFVRLRGEEREENPVQTSWPYFVNNNLPWLLNAQGNCYTNCNFLRTRKDIAVPFCYSRIVQSMEAVGYGMRTENVISEVASRENLERVLNHATR